MDADECDERSLNRFSVLGTVCGRGQSRRVAGIQPGLMDTPA